MSRIRRGWALTKKSWGLLRENRELLRFPLYGAAATTVCAVIVVGPGLYLIDDGKVAFGGPLAVIGFYLLAVIGTFFSVGLAATADMIFHGREATVSDGIAVARSRFSQVCGWAAVLGGIGLVIGLRGHIGILTGTPPTWYEPSIITTGLIGIALTVGAFLTVRQRRIPWILLGSSSVALVVALSLTSTAF